MNPYLQGTWSNRKRVASAHTIYELVCDCNARLLLQEGLLIGGVSLLPCQTRAKTLDLGRRVRPSPWISRKWDPPIKLVNCTMWRDEGVQLCAVRSLSPLSSCGIKIFITHALMC